MSVLETNIKTIKKSFQRKKIHNTSLCQGSTLLIQQEH